MDEKLRFVIELQNKASAELRKLSKEMDGVKPGAGAKATANWFQQLESVSASTTKTLRPMTGALNTVGASSLAAGLSVVGLVQQFRELAKAMPALAELSRQTGMSRTEIERLKQTASNLSIDPSKMTASLQHFSREMVQFHNQTGELYAEMQNGASGLAEKIRKESPAEAYRDTLSWLAAIPEAARKAGKSQADAVQTQRYWTEKALGDGDLSQLFGRGANGLREAYQQAAQDVGEITDEMVKQAEAFDRSITRFDRSWTTLKQDLGSTVLPGLTAATDAMRALFDEVKHDPELIGIGAAGIGALYARRKIMNAVSGGAGAGISSAAAAQIEGAAVKQGTASASFAEAVAEFRAGVREMSARGNGPGGMPAEGGKPAGPGGGSPGYTSLFGRGALAAWQLFDLVQGMPEQLERAKIDNAPMDPQVGREAGWGDAVRHFLRGGTSPAAAGWHPADDDRQTRARASDAPDRSLDGVVVGEVLHLRNTLRTAAKAGDGAFRPAGFNPAGGPGLAAALDPEATIAAGTRRGFVEAFHELQGLSDTAGASGGAGGGFTPAAFHPGGGMPGGRSAAAAGAAGQAPSGPARSGGGGRSASAAGQVHGADAFPGQGGTADTGGAGATAGMRARNLGNIGYFHQHDPGLVGPSNSRDVDHSIALYATQEDGIRAAARLALHKYQSGMRNTAALIAGRGGWTPGALGPGASVNIARAMGLTNSDDLHLDDPAQMRKFLHGLAIQEHGKAGAYYTPEMIDRALSGRGATTAIGPTPQAALQPGAGGSSPAAAGHISGTLRIGDETFAYGSGGRNGAAHIPFGDHEITPDVLGAWGRSHGAMGVDNNAMWDKSLGRLRTGIEMHAAKSAELVTSGCLGFMESQYPRLKTRVRDMIAKTGHAYLHVDEKGASITPSPHLAPLPEIKPAPPPAQTEHRVSLDPLHVNMTHTESGRTRVAVKHGEGVKVSLRTAPTLVETG